MTTPVDQHANALHLLRQAQTLETRTRPWTRATGTAARARRVSGRAAAVLDNVESALDELRPLDSQLTHYLLPGAGLSARSA